MGLLNNNYAQPNPMYGTQMWNLVNSDLIINCEGFKGDFMSKDVCWDGVNTVGVCPKILTAFHNYDPCSAETPPLST